MSWSSSPRYSLLQRSSSSENLHEDKDASGGSLCSHCQRSLNSSSSYSSLSFWAIIVSLLSVSINCLILLASSKVVNRCIDPMTTVTNDNIHLLRRPTPFIGFDNITRPVPPVHREFVNFPQVIQQVNEAKPDFVYDDDPLRYMSIKGLVSPEAMRVQMTPKVSTLVQFRVVDYGMEKCELHVNFPVNSTTDANSHPFLITVNRLDGRVPLNTKTLSYTTKPGLTSSLVQQRVNPSVDTEIHWWQTFDCKWDELLIFELACYQTNRLDSGDDCRVEWWQERGNKDPQPAIYLKQYSTV